MLPVSYTHLDVYKRQVWGSLLGVMTIYTIQNILGLLSVNYYMYTAVQSIVILIAIIFENVKNRVIQ